MGNSWLSAKAEMVKPVWRPIETMVKKAKDATAKMQVMVGSVCDKAVFLAKFVAIGSAVNIGANIVVAYQGNTALELIAARLKDIGDTLKAQTSLMAQYMFPQYVYDMILEGLDKTSGDHKYCHWFFVYHPDDAWSPTFSKLLSEKPPSRRFCGYTTQLDALFVFMLAARTEIDAAARRAKRRGQSFRPVKFHVLIPAYQPVVITQYLSFPKGVGDLVVEGKLHGSDSLVWLNVPKEQGYMLQGVGNWEPDPPGLWKRTMNYICTVEASPEPRVLGTRQPDPKGDAEKNTEDGSEDEYDDDGWDVETVRNADKRSGGLKFPHDKKRKSRKRDPQSESGGRRKTKQRASESKHKEANRSQSRSQTQDSRSRGRSIASYDPRR